VEGLVPSYRAAGGEYSEADLPALERRLHELWSRGRAAYPRLKVGAEAFAEHLGRCGAPVAEGLHEVHAEDLYLVCAGLAGDKGAAAEIRAVARPVIAKALKRVSGASAIVEEVEQRLLDSMFVGGDAGPKLLSYAGRGPLGTWIGISSQRQAYTILRHEQAELRARQEAVARHRLAAIDPETAAIKEKYRAQFQQAMDRAIETLDDREKMLYRMHLVEGCTLERIAAAYGVSHPTIIRWLRKARERILDEAKRHLRQSLPISSGEFDSIARLLASEIDLDITRAVATSR
jgi:RNA polymerase sigma-70 factor, ECF subfamily